MQEERKKVLFLVTKGNFGGAQRYVFDLARSLPQDEYEVAVAFGEAGMLEQKLDQIGIRTIHLKSLGRDIKLFKEFKSFFEIYKLLKSEHPDVFHINSSKGGLGALAGRLAGIKKIVFTAHGWYFNEDQSILWKKITKFLLWLTVIFSHTTICVSERERKDMIGMLFTKKKLIVIHNGVEITPSEPKSTLRHLLAPHIHQGVWIGTISELHKNKGLDFLLEAFSKLSEKYLHIALVIIGEGEERKNLESIIQKLHLEDKVYLLGFVPDAEKVVGAFDIFTLTSRKEGLPYTILEAGAEEVPIVASDVGGISEIVTPKFNGILIPMGNIKMLETELHKLIDHPERRTLFGQRLGQRIRKRFTLERMVRETRKVYEDTRH